MIIDVHRDQSRLRMTSRRGHRMLHNVPTPSRGCPCQLPRFTREKLDHGIRSLYDTQRYELHRAEACLNSNSPLADMVQTAFPYPVVSGFVKAEVPCSKQRSSSAFRSLDNDGFHQYIEHRVSNQDLCDEGLRVAQRVRERLD